MFLLSLLHVGFFWAFQEAQTLPSGTTHRGEPWADLHPALACSASAQMELS